MPHLLAVSTVLFLATAALCLVAEFARGYQLRRLAAILAVVTVAAADAAMLGSVPELGLSWPALSATPPAQQPAARRQRRLLDADGGAGSGGERRGSEKEGGRGDARPADDGEGEVEDDVEVIIEPARRRVAGFFAGLAVSSPEPARHPLPWDVFKDCPECPEMIVMPPGETVIGAPPADPLADAAERPQRRVRLWPGFAIARFEISSTELARAGLTGAAGAARCLASAVPAGERHAAATCLTWNEASDYAGWLSRITGRHYRLPSAAEWEYAARLAATPRRVASASGGDDAAGLRPLALGGGVAEYVEDCWADTLENASETSAAYLPNRTCWRRIVKDGAEDEDARWQRASARRPIAHDVASPRLGFRVVRDLDDPAAKAK